jgi:hypothetical protein
MSQSAHFCAVWKMELQGHPRNQQDRTIYGSVAEPGCCKVTMLQPVSDAVANKLFQTESSLADALLSWSQACSCHGAGCGCGS